MRTQVQVGSWPLLGLDGDGKPIAGPVLVVAWRRLTWKEYESFRLRRDLPTVLYMEVYEKVLVQGPPLSEVPAGIAFFIGKQELETCPFSGKFPLVSGAIEQARARVQGSWLLIAQGVVASIFHYSLDEVCSWPSDVFFERMAQAEQLTGAPLIPSDPKATKKPKKGLRLPGPQAPARREGDSIDNNSFTFTR